MDIPFSIHTLDAFFVQWNYWYRLFTVSYQFQYFCYKLVPRTEPLLSITGGIEKTPFYIILYQTTSEILAHLNWTNTCVNYVPKNIAVMLPDFYEERERHRRRTDLFAFLVNLRSEPGGWRGTGGTAGAAAAQEQVLAAVSTAAASVHGQRCQVTVVHVWCVLQRGLVDHYLGSSAPGRSLLVLR